MAVGFKSTQGAELGVDKNNHAFCGNTEGRRTEADLDWIGWTICQLTVSVVSRKAKFVSQHLRPFVSCQLECWPFVAHPEPLASSCNLLPFLSSFSTWSLLSEIMPSRFSQAGGWHQEYPSVDEFLNSSTPTAWKCITIAQRNYISITLGSLRLFLAWSLQIEKCEFCLVHCRSRHTEKIGHKYVYSNISVCIINKIRRMYI